jgi:hypothetical protein
MLTVNDCPVGTAVLRTRPPLAPYEVGDAVIVEVRAGRFPLDGDGLVPVWFYGLRWPDSSTTWHLRREFEPTPVKELQL